jgi:ribonuclease BN (tRNA processing enzyme)
MDIRVLGAHNSETSTTSCVTLLIDEKLAIEAGGLTSRLTFEEQSKLDAIVITHNHLDHVRDIPTLALNFYRRSACIDIYSTAHVCGSIKEHMLNSEMYPQFHAIPKKKPTVNFLEVEPLGLQWIDGHSVLPVPVNHEGDAVGYLISDRQNKSVFFTGDTGPNLTECWQHVSPQLLIIDVTLSNENEDFARRTRHLTPRLLEAELVKFREIHGYIPAVLSIHMDANQETQIRSELHEVEQHLHTEINMAYEEMCLAV